MLELHQSLPYLLLLLAISVFNYFLGHFSLSFLRIRFELLAYDLLAKILTGTTLTSVFYAIFQTKGFTFLLPAVFLLAILAFKTQKKDPNFHFFDFQLFKNKNSLFYAAVFLGIFCIKISSLYDLETGFLIEHFANATDFLIYAQIADFLNLTGIENTLKVRNILEAGKHGLVPYHYFELWLVAFWTKISGLNTFYIFELVLFPFFLFLLFLANESLFRTKLIYRWYFSFFSVIFIFSASIYNQFFLNYPFFDAVHFIYGDYAVPFFQIHLTISSIFFIIFLLLSIQNKTEIGIFILCFLPIFHFSTVFLGAGMGLWFIFRRKFDKDFFYFISYYSFFSIYTVGLFWFSKSEINLYYSDMLFFSDSKKILENLFYHLYHQPFLFFPFSFLFLFFLKKYDFGLLFFSLFFGLFVASISEIKDWQKFFTFLATPIFRTLFTVFLFYCVHAFETKKWIFWISIACFCWLSFRTIRNIQLKTDIRVSKCLYSKDYLARVQNKLFELKTDKKYLIGGFFMGTSLFDKIYNDTWAYIHYEGKYMLYMENNLHFINMSWRDSLHKKSAIPFNPIILKNTEVPYFFRNNPQKNWTDFIKAYQISFIILPPQAVLPDELWFLVKTQIKDEKTGEIFLVLR